MTPPKLLLLTAGFFLLGGGLLVAATAGSRGLAACAIGLLVSAAALAMQLGESELDVSPEQQRAANEAQGKRENPKTAVYNLRHPRHHKLHRGLARGSRQAFTNQDLWWV